MTPADRPPGVLLIHGGLFEAIGPDEFWFTPGIVGGLEMAGFDVMAPARVIAPNSWTEEVEHLCALLPSVPSRWSVVAASNGCSVAVRMAVDYEELVDRLVLCWPATAGDPELDQLLLAPDSMLRGETLRGVKDAELAGMKVAVAIIPSDPPNRYHQAATADRLLSIIPGAKSTSAFPESPKPDFAHHRDEFLKTLTSLLG